ncbi:MAG: CapA family protein [Vicinamibacterales bacterium]
MPANTRLRPHRSGERSGSSTRLSPGRASVLVASDWAPIRAFDSLARHDPEALYGDVLPILRDADLRIVNCEAALTRAKKPVWKSGAVFKGEPAHAKALAAVPFDVACLANNHVLDYGVGGLRETIDILARHGIRTVGAGLDGKQAHAPLSIDVNGLKVHIVNVSEGEDLTASKNGPGVFGWDIPRALSEIAKCRQRGGAVICIAHCGLEYTPYPPPYVVGAFRSMADAGASAVVGHHPHVVQGVEWRGGRPIVYSLGNFAFYQLTNLYYRKLGAALVLNLEGERVEGIELHPYRITDDGLRQLDRDESRAFKRVLARVSRPFRTPLGHERAWQAYLAWYGAAGFKSEVQGIIARMDAEPEKAAAMFRNRITTMQHVELWRDLLTRLVRGQQGGYPRDAYETVVEYHTKV